REAREDLVFAQRRHGELVDHALARAAREPQPLAAALQLERQVAGSPRVVGPEQAPLAGRQHAAREASALPGGVLQPQLREVDRGARAVDELEPVARRARLVDPGALVQGHHLVDRDPTLRRWADSGACIWLTRAAGHEPDAERAEPPAADAADHFAATRHHL